MPLVDSLLPRVASMTQQALLSDPMQWGRTIMQATELVGGDAIAISVDPDMTLLGCGANLVWDGNDKSCASAIKLTGALDTSGLSDYLKMLTGVVQSPLRDKPCAVAMLGPATLASRVFDDAPGKDRFNELKGHMTALADTICRLRPELLIFIEDEAALVRTPLPDLRRIYNTLTNVASYYEVDTALLTDSITPEQASALSKLKLQALIVTEQQAGEPLAELLDAAVNWPLLGLPLPVSDLEQVQALQVQIQSLAVDPAKLFHITPGQLPRDCDLEQLREVKRQISTH